MRNILQEQRRSSIIAAVITIFMGLLLILVPNRSVRFLCGLLGAALMITGIVYILGWFSRRRQGDFPAWFLIPGLILVSLGLWLLTNPASVIVLLQFIFAAILLFHGIIDLQGAVVLIRNRFYRWWLDLALAAVTIVLGMVILINPFQTFEMLTLLIGISLIYDGISDLVLIHRLTQALRGIERLEDVLEGEGWAEDD